MSEENNNNKYNSIQRWAMLNDVTPVPKDEQSMLEAKKTNMAAVESAAAIKKASDKKNQLIALGIVLIVLLCTIVEHRHKEEEKKRDRARMAAAMEKRKKQVEAERIERIERERILLAKRPAEVEKIMKDMIECPAGTFEMGSPSDELGHHNNENQHQVTISKPFYISKYLVTQTLYKAITGENPSQLKGMYPGKDYGYPVENITWLKAKEFCDMLNEVSCSAIPADYKFDLPTEAQWEYACRAGTTTALNNGCSITTKYKECPNLDEIGWYEGNSQKENQRTRPVGLKKPNAWGLYDMHGNVSEWCRDWYANYPTDSVTDPEGPENGTERVCRGGNWYVGPSSCRSGYRDHYPPKYKDTRIGFRLVLVPIKNNENSTNNANNANNENNVN